MGLQIGGSIGKAFEDTKKSLQTNYDDATGKNGRAAQIGTIGGFVGGSALGGGIGGFEGANAGGQLGASPTPPTPPKSDPTLDSIKAQQIADAQQFRTDLPNTQQSMYEQAYKNERRNLAQNIQSVKQNASSRGLLNSGMEQSGELGQRADSNANLSQTRTEINNSTESQARQLEANAVQSGVQQQAALGEIQDQVMSQALNNMAARRQALTGVGQGIGSVAGTIAANRNTSGSNYGLNQPTTYGT